jgi:hypothetical protein
MTTQIASWSSPIAVPKVSKIVCSFLDTAATSFGRATHYNTREEQQAAEINAHDKMMGLDRDLYAAFLTLPGVTDRSRQMGLRNLLSLPRTKDGIFTTAQETDLLYGLLQQIPTQRLLKIIDAFRFTNLDQGIVKANNARTRKLILRTLLNANKLEFWAVKYRQKIKRAITHALGQRRASIVRSILNKKPYDRSDKEWSILSKFLNKHINSRRSAKKGLNDIYESIGFALGATNNLTLPLFVAYEQAKIDLSKGANLPPEVLEGIRASFHPKTPAAEVIKLVGKSGSVTKGQKMIMQRTAEKAGAKIEFDARDYDAVKLYIYAYERGLTNEIRKALDDKAKKAAEIFPVEYNNIGIIIDGSRSMEGDRTQFLRPISTALAMRDMLQYTGKSFITAYAGGGLLKPGDDTLVVPSGDTSLSEALIQLLQANHELDTIFVVSDGYENCPAGRFAEVMLNIRAIGIETPIYHLNPVMAAESKGVRQLSPEVASMPIQRPDALGLTILRGMIESDPISAINRLLSLAMKTKAMKKALR